MADPTPTSAQLMNQLFSQIYDLVTKEPAPGDQGKLPDEAKKGGKFSNSNTAIHISIPGIALYEEDFSNMWTPGNPTGLKDQTAGFSLLVDSIPPVGSSRYVQSPKRVSQAYVAVLAGANAVNEEMKATTRDTLTKINKFLYEEKEEPLGPFAEPGEKPSLKRDKTAVFKRYEKLKEDIGEVDDELRKVTKEASDVADWQKDYTDAQIEEIVKDPAKKKRIVDRALRASEDLWSAKSSPLLRRRRALMEEFSGDSNNKFVEQALQYQATHGNELSQALIANAKELAKLGDWTRVGSDIPVKLAFPSSTKFADKSNQDGWTKITATTTDYQKKESTLSVKVDAGVKVNFIWSLNVGADFAREEKHSEVVSKSITAELEVAFINISRPWMDATIFSEYVQWNAGGDQRAGSVSSGKIETQTDNHFLPFIPMQMIVARNVKLIADWSKDNQDFVSNASSSRTSFGYGPFSASASHEHKDSQFEQDTKGRGAGLSFSGIQCLGFVSWVPPRCAPLDGDGSGTGPQVKTVDATAIESVLDNSQAPPDKRRAVAEVLDAAK